MFQCFFPDQYLDSAYEIDFEGLYAKGYRGLIWDFSVVFYQTIKEREWSLSIVRSNRNSSRMPISPP